MILLRCGFDVAVFDRQFALCRSRPARAVQRMGVIEHASIAGAVAHSALVIVATGRDAAVEIARSAADHVEPGCDYIDASGCGSRDIAKVARALGDIVRLTMADREALLVRARTIPVGLPALKDVVRYLSAAPTSAVSAIQASAQILPFTPAMCTARRLPCVQAA